MATRADFDKAVGEFYDWYWDGAEEQFGEIDPVYPKICDVRSLDDIEKSFTKVTTGVGMDSIPERDETEAVEIDNPVEGYTVMIKKRTYELITPASFELSQDFTELRISLKIILRKMLPVQ